MKLSIAESRAVQLDGFKLSPKLCPKRCQKSCPPRRVSEEHEHRLVMQWARLMAWGDGKLADVLHHSPNGGKRSPREGAKFKEMGMQAGFPDFQIYVPRQGFHGLFVALKAKKGVLSPAQQVVLARLKSYGYQTAVCYGFEHAKRVMSEYMGVYLAPFQSEAACTVTADEHDTKRCATTRSTKGV